jgi:hypothetical protein
MSLRERWIVYPLLFLTLGIALRDKVVPPSRFGNFYTNIEAGTVAAPRIRCNELVCDRIKTKQSECNMLLVTSPDGKPVVAAGIDSNGRGGMIETFNAKGTSQVRLLSGKTGGIVTAIQRNGTLALVLGDTGDSFGVFADIGSLGKLIPLTLPWRMENKPPKSASPDNSKPPIKK